ncbi:selenocysteine-specific translation elongation factor [Thermosulfuriphilus sp.]
MKKIILGTAGHIDHGKTTLVKALTGIDTDRLKEEKLRGITIELGFAHLKLPSGEIIGIVDVPGHERFVKNMVAGASGIDLVALVIAADEGIMPQTREHLAICDLLGVRTGLVVLTKKDLVEEDWLELVREEISDFVRGTFLEGAPIVAVSATNGEGIAELKEILDHLVAQIRQRSKKGPFRMPIDRVFTVRGFGTVVTGTTISGRIRVGDQIEIMPKRLKGRVRNIQVYGQDREEALAGERTALNLQGLEKESLERGDVVCRPGGLRPSWLLDLHLRYLSEAGRPLKTGTRVRFHVGTCETLGRIVLFGDEELAPGEEALAQIRLERPVAVWRGDHYVIRSYSPVITIGGGTVLNPLPPKRKRSQPRHLEELRLLKEANDEDLILYHLRQAALKGLTLEELSIRTALFDKALEGIISRLKTQKKVVALEAEGRTILLEGRRWQELKEIILERLRLFHQKNPLLRGLSKEELRSRLPSELDQRAFAQLLNELISKGQIIQDQEVIRLSSHKIVLAEEQERLKRQIESIFRRAGLKVPDRDEALSRFREQPELALKLFDYLVQEGRLVRLKDGLYFHQDVLKEVEKKVVSFLKENKEMSIAQFRELTRTSRKYMIPLLEYLDHKKVTLRIGDKRVLRKKDL